MQPNPNISKAIFASLFLFLGSFCSNAQSQITVCPSCPINNIQQAVNQADRHSTVIIKEGVYRENAITITKPLKLIGENYPVIEGEHKGEIIAIKSDSVTIKGLQIQNVGTSYIKDWAGINVYKSDYCIISDNRLIDTFFGIYLQKAAHCQVFNNELIGKAEQEMSSGNAIHLWYCKNILVENNIVKNHRDGIYLEFVDNSIIKDNFSEGNIRYGLHFMFSDNDQYLGNTFKNNGAGVAVMFSHDIIMDGNLFEKNWGSNAYGILLKEIYDGEIKNNRFIENTIGIYGESANRLKIHNNEFRNNGWAFKVRGSCMDNSIKANNFINNTFDIATNSKRNYNVYEGNYWSDYAGYDLDKDGIGDVPYRPMKLFSYVVTRTETSIILLRSLFIDIINFAEKVTPVFTPETLIDSKPLMRPTL